MFNYLKAQENAIFRAFIHGFKKKMLYIRPEDLKIGMHVELAWNTHWVHAGGPAPPERNCTLFHTLILPYCNFIPAKCQECWKVVARPNTVAELFKISEIQLSEDQNSKAGIEKRPSVGGNYGAYWYNDTIEEGEECRKRIREMCDEKISPEVQVFLKRGCTEFEHKYGSSLDWKVTEEAKEMEALITENVAIVDTSERKQPWYVIDDIHSKWVEFAYERGDKTYLEFTGGKPLFPNYVTYTSEKE